MKEKVYNWLVRENEYVRREYEKYVMTNIEEHYESRFKHWKILWKLNWHYRIKKSQTPLLYWDLQTQTTEEAQKKITEKGKNVVTRRFAPYFLVRDLAAYDIVSFDVFDTLVLRPLKDPADVFILIGEQLNIYNFSEIRKKAETTVRQCNLAQYGNHEVRLEDIYCEIERMTGLDKEKGMQTEIDIEFELIYPNPYMKCIFDLLKNQGRYIVAISDMYLSHDIVMKILKKSGYDIDELFVSNEYHCNKRNGGLYGQILAKHSPEMKMIHLGDNYTSDIKMAENKGIHHRYYRNCNAIGKDVYKNNSMSELIGSLYEGLINTTMFNGMNEFNSYFEYGYVYGGLYVLGYCNWIIKQAKNDNIDKILFLSRDGDIYKQVFELLDCNMEIEYVYWSRMAATISNMKANRYDFFKRLIEHKARAKQTLTVSNILEIIGICEEDIKLKKYRLKKETVLCVENSKYIENILQENFDKILEINEVRFKQMKKMLVQTVANHKNIAVVDVGWTGTNSLAIKHLIENQYALDCKIHCYLAASSVPDSTSNLTACIKDTLKTYMFSQIKNRDLYEYHRSANNGTNSIYFELFTQACMSSFQGIDANGDWQFDIAEVENYEMIREIQKGILYFSKQYLNYADKFPIFHEISGRDAYIPYQTFSQNLNFVKEHFKHFIYNRGIGSNSNAKPETIEDIIFHAGL